MKSFLEKKPYFIAEIGSAHEGNALIAKEMIKAAADAGVDAVKFQIYKASELIHPILMEKQYERCLQLELFEEEWFELARFAKQKRVRFLASIFGSFGLKMAKRIPNFDWIKIASGDLNYYPFIEEVSKLGKPMLISTGMGNMTEIKIALEAASRYLYQDQIAIMHCVSLYPTLVEQARLEYIALLKKRFAVEIGHSDHCEGDVVCREAILRGATIIEKHFTITPDVEVGDHCHSLTPKEFEDLILWTKKLDKKKIRFDTEEELIEGFDLEERPDEGNLKNWRRGIYAKKSLKEGEEIKASDLMPVRPNNGLSVNFIEQVVGKKIVKKVKAYEPIINEMFEKRETKKNKKNME
jgi:sialic acid synthase SpsE